MADDEIRRYSSCDRLQSGGPDREAPVRSAGSGVHDVMLEQRRVDQGLDRLGVPEGWRAADRISGRPASLLGIRHADASLETKLDESQSRLAKAEAALKERLATVEKEVT